nr:immunoglobulin heavy chain junction region [Mus musculus]
ITVQGTPMLWT